MSVVLNSMWNIGIWEYDDEDELGWLFTSVLTPVLCVSSLQWRLALQEWCGLDWERCGSGPGYWLSTFWVKGRFWRDTAICTDGVWYGAWLLLSSRLCYWDHSVPCSAIFTVKLPASCLAGFKESVHVKRKCRRAREYRSVWKL